MLEAGRTAWEAPLAVLVSVPAPPLALTILLMFLGSCRLLEDVWDRVGQQCGPRALLPVTL